MKFFVAFIFLVATTAAAPQPKSLAAVASHIQAIAAAIHSPSTDSATAHLLEHILAHITAAAGEPIEAGPAIVDFPVPEEVVEPIAVGPAIVDFHVPEEVVQPVLPVQPSPVVFGPIAPGSPAPLVQILVNINSQPTMLPMPPVGESVVQRPVPVIDPVDVVDEAENISPVIVVDGPTSMPEPVHVVETSPVVVEPVIVSTPVIHVPVVTLPEDLN